MATKKASILAQFAAIFLTLLVADVRCNDPNDKLRAVYSWKALEFTFPNEQAREAAIAVGDFIPGSPMPIDVDTYLHDGRFGRRIFVTIPRFQKGVPVTLGFVTTEVTADGNPKIAPYPNWNWQRSGDCDGLTSVWRIEIDRCGRLWVMDTGKIEERQVCPAQLLVFSLETNRLISRYRFPQSQVRESSLFVTPIVDARGHMCHDTFVYIADVSGFSLLVYDHQNLRSWRISNNLFYPYPNYGTFDIKNEVFDLMDGILGMTLSPLRPYGDRILYFHSLASKVESYVPTSVIRNYTLFADNPEAASRSFVAFKNERSTQSAAQAMDKNGVLFFGLLSELAIGCWNSVNYDYGDEFIERIAQNEDTLQFPSGIKVITSKNGRQELWVMTISFQRVMTGTMSPNETNFRIQAAVIDELVRGTKCDVASININSVRQSTHGSLTFPTE
ncbi:protein yellow-like isoform X2 [Athalia rosae]|nr:protein yellow-like isoform X2 [Athalia rosae]XP_012269403.2 protein yellow-like isoform X2 [Athalia rosae]XP_048510659.1 protein yellow-like isoform X2 [Athalia rosae]XP_048510660.1 protein yellow-like isoform X2 [Athalia rosae]